jgi:hypothetical protein
VVDERAIVVRGLAQPGATVTREIEFWFDEHVVADARGRWSFALGLADGENVFTFRLADDFASRQTLTVYYQQP